jgi:hypothetical protein
VFLLYKGTGTLVDDTRIHASGGTGGTGGAPGVDNASVKFSSAGGNGANGGPGFVCFYRVA